MKEYTLQDLLDYTKAEPPFEMGEAYIRRICGSCGLSTEKLERLTACWKQIESDPKMLELFRFLTWEMTRQVQDGAPYVGLHIPLDSPYADCADFLLLLSVSQAAEKKVIARGIPETVYAPMLTRAVAPHLKKYEQTGSCAMRDTSWPYNFFSRAIYLIDRFQFIPNFFDDEFRLYRNRKTGEVVGLYLDGIAVDAEGERLISHNTNAEEAFRTSFRETQTEYIGNFMNPLGLTSREIRHLPKAEWEIALQPGDWTLAVHIPAGEGYTPARLEHSMQLALEFFEKYFPEIPIKGFRSGSWLYDARLSLLLPETSNIVSVQRRFYNYSRGGGTGSLCEHLFHTANPDLETATAETTLQKNALQALKNGNRFCSTGMIVLKEDVPGLAEKQPYIRKADLEEFKRVIADNWK